MGVIGSLLLSLVLTAVAYMAFPFIMLSINHGKFEKKRANKIVLWNSIVVGAFFCILSALIEGVSTWNAAPAIIYYWINRSILTNRADNEVKKQETVQSVPNYSMHDSNISSNPNYTTAETSKSKIETNIEAAEFQFCRI